MEITFDQAAGLVEAALHGQTRREIVAGLSAKTLGASLVAMRDAMRAHRFRAAGTQLFLERAVTAFDGRTRADGFHILHDWDGVAQQTNPDIIPVDVLHFLAEQRGAEASSELELAILLDYYFMHVIALLTMRIWDDGDADENLARLNAMLAELQGPNGSGQQFAADAETLMLIGTSHFEPEEWGYGALLSNGPDARRGPPVQDRSWSCGQHGLSPALRVRSAVRPRHAGAARRQHRRLSVAVLCACRGDA